MGTDMWRVPLGSVYQAPSICVCRKNALMWRRYARFAYMTLLLQYASLGVHDIMITYDYVPPGRQEYSCTRYTLTCTWLSIAANFSYAYEILIAPFIRGSWGLNDWTRTRQRSLETEQPSTTRTTSRIIWYDMTCNYCTVNMTPRWVGGGIGHVVGASSRQYY